MSDVFEVAPPKAEPKAKPKPAPKPEPKTEWPDDVAVKAEAAPKKTRKKRAAPVQEIDEHMLFMKLYNELSELPKGSRSRLLASLTKQLA